MRCTTAKQNPVLMQLAIRHYLNNDRGNKTPIFTFLSLYTDNEPYPLPELLIMLGILRKQLAQLRKVAGRMENQAK